MEGALTERVVRVLLDYWEQARSGQMPVVKLRNGEELKAEFDRIGVPLSISDKQERISDTEFIGALEKVLTLSVATSHPQFNNQLYGAPDLVGILADWAVVLLNSNCHTYEVAPVFTLMENELFQKMGRLLGGKFATNHDGLFVPGGSLSTIYSLLLARYQAAPQSRSEGLQSLAKPLVAFTSASSHYSYLKAANLVGIGTSNLVKTDATGRMDARALRAAIDDAISQGKQPFFIGATAGTTVQGAFDPFEDLADIAEEYGLWYHVDACWGGPVLFTKKHRHMLRGAERADSFAINPHKMLGAPLQCSMFLTHHSGILKECNAAHAEYLFQPDKNNAELDSGDKTIQCGRRIDQFKLWAMWKMHGDEGLGARVDRCIGLIEYMAERLQAVRDEQGRTCFALVSPPQFANLLFYCVPPSMRDTFASVEQCTPEILASLGKVAPKIKDRMQKKGLGLVGYQPVNGLPNVWRMVMTGDVAHVSDAHIDALINDMLECSADL